MLASVVACFFLRLAGFLLFFVVPKSNKELCVFLSSLRKAFVMYYEKAKPFPMVGEVAVKSRALAPNH